MDRKAPYVTSYNACVCKPTFVLPERKLSQSSYGLGKPTPPPNITMGGKILLWNGCGGGTPWECPHRYRLTGDNTVEHLNAY